MSTSANSSGVTRRSALIICGVLLLGGLSWGVLELYGASRTSGNAVVTDSDGETHVLPLATDTRYVVTTSLGTNTIVIEGGTAHIEDADCENKDCERQGIIDTVGQTLICLPHKLVVTISDADAASSTGSSQSTDVDGLSR